QVVVAGLFSPVGDGYSKPGLAPAATRCRLARLACASTSDWLAVDAWESRQPNWTRTRVVAEQLASRLNSLVLGHCRSRLSHPHACPISSLDPAHDCSESGKMTTSEALTTTADCVA
ncbi:unnamed protein product, partial [Protopolystoma xenopodis]